MARQPKRHKHQIVVALAYQQNHQLTKKVSKASMIQISTNVELLSWLPKEPEDP